MAVPRGKTQDDLLVMLIFLAAIKKGEKQNQLFNYSPLGEGVN
jgi:hypothetical protein